MKPIEFSEFDLPNGLHCIVYENHRSPIVTVDVWYHVGSKNESPERTGFAHLFEHMMFQGSANVGKTEHFSYVQNAGGSLNGSTTQDRTNYYETLPSNRLELGLWLESDRMMSLQVTAENFENQREVVKEERRMHYDNRPYGTVYEEMCARLFIDHPYKWIPIGSMKHLEDATLSDAQDFYNTFYAPNNATLILSGDVTLEKARTLAEKYFGEIAPSQHDIPRPKAESTLLNREITETFHDNVQLPALFMAYRICDIKHPDSDVLGAISDILSDGESSRLYRKLVYEEQLVRSIDTHSMPLEQPGLFFISAIGMPDTDLNAVKARIDEEMAKIIAGEVGEAELEKAKNGAEMGIIKSFSTIMGTGENLAHFHTYYGSASEINNELERVSNITPDDVQRAAKKYFETDGRVVLYWLPK
ncbi:peptidase M16 domain protein [Chloroherpeton thalassium ATCC 35110]|uniref:Peptidase M16 domain protein n=1 Tax=Chloroherpeton thalassium (strain ATCC 35110 / GB-78) TaxID=517418 RepID=B3QYA3_CHLT3|nr:pitrilysin family protein [Chloroherpeton thalassium]ACF15069.1 peptidase M16 domain protein [Chloroherpeton thalassium ATCC 35110]